MAGIGSMSSAMMAKESDMLAVHCSHVVIPREPWRWQCLLKIKLGTSRLEAEPGKMRFLGSGLLRTRYKEISGNGVLPVPELIFLNTE
jgi:hypothetical protein